MKIIKSLLLPALIGMLSVTMYSCKAKKVVAKPAPAPVAQEKPAPVPEAPAPVQQAPAPVEAKPDFNFSRIQFEFNSAVLKTESFAVLEQAANEMKKAPATKFQLNGHSSAEGSPAHNMKLSVDRANSVKSFLVNTGLDAANFSVKGFGESEPVTENQTEEGRVQNRRVEIKLLP